ncbi:MAG: isoprenylcysteine carboxylmethyltransferase family protein [Candidatus Thermoplasmatota archaeon]|nr:isoprenylcysteine carboxylmethyltransferase family protein [Candidatus Thermoplasmatota archaeon]
MIYGFVYADNDTIIWIEYFGVGVFLLSGVFGMLPVIVFPRKGGVEKGKSYIHTTKIVDTGIYSVVRHPQYSAFILWAIGAMLLFQNWIVIILGFPEILLTYFDMIREDKQNIQKFGKS